MVIQGDEKGTERMSELSFPVMHKVGNVDIFVQLQMEIYW